LKTIVRNIIFIVIAVGLTVPRDFLVQLTQLPDTIEHYRHHNEEHEPIGFFAFMSLHLSGGDAHDVHHHEDDSPYRHHHSAECFQMSAFADLGGAFSVPVKPPSIKKNTLPVQDDFALSQFAPSIWQPPKIG